MDQELPLQQMFKEWNGLGFNQEYGPEAKRDKGDAYKRFMHFRFAFVNIR
jgi:hypothetical protein